MEEAPEVVGHFDAYRSGKFIGWAWRPNSPDQFVTVEVIADGFVIGEAVASGYRGDLRSANIGHGFHGFEIAADLNLDRPEPVKVLVRAKDGAVLTGGEAEIGGKPSTDDQENPEFKAFVAAVLGRRVVAGQAPPTEPAPRVNFIVHCATGRDPSAANALAGNEYSYSFVMEGFIPILERFGTVHVVAYPAEEVDVLHEGHLVRGETSLFLSFAPPHRTTLGLRCPTVPVIAWEYPTIPSAVWDDDLRHDWRYVLRQTGRAITLSRFAARAVKAAMGADFPVVAVPVPVWDRQRVIGADVRPRPEGAIAIAIDGFVYDTKGQHFEVDTAIPPRPEPPWGTAEVSLDGVIFTSVFSPKDGRKNWLDILTAFIFAFRDTPDATLVLKMIGADASFWWWEFHDALHRLPAFACRVVVLNGFLDDARYRGLIDASHWVVNASRAEGQCLPLLEFMCAGRPAVAPAHTAMADYIDDANAVVVESEEEFCKWPHDPRHEFTTTRHRISWSSLQAAFGEAYEIVKSDPDRYRSMSAAALRTMQAFCSDDVVAAKLDSFLGLGRQSGQSHPVFGLLVEEPAA